MPVPALPAEIIDRILDFVFDCRSHPWSCVARPCPNWHDKPLQILPDLLRLRLISHHWNNRLQPALFYHIKCTGEIRRHRHVVELSHSHLLSHIRVLRVEIAPQDLKGQILRVNSSTVSVDQKLLYYFEVLPIFLKGLLRRYRRVRNLHIQSTYVGILERRVPKNEAIDGCMKAICTGVRQAKMPDLEELHVGVPYEGGYENFFGDLDGKKYSQMLERCGKNLRTANVKLYDHQNNFTTMSFF